MLLKYKIQEIKRLAALGNNTRQIAFDMNIPYITCRKIITKNQIIVNGNKKIAGTHLEDKIIELICKNCNVAYIALELNLLPITIFKHLEKHGLSVLSTARKDREEQGLRKTKNYITALAIINDYLLKNNEDIINDKQHIINEYDIKDNREFNTIMYLILNIRGQNIKDEEVSETVINEIKKM